MGHAKRLEPIVVDKHLDAAALGAVLGRRGMSAAVSKPSRAYRGEYADDEDFSDVLQLGWQNEAAVLTADVEMIDKAKRFEKQYPSAESCLRGVIVLPPGKEAQIGALSRFIAGEIACVAMRTGEIAPKSLDDVETYNLAIDLRLANPSAHRLCDCE